MFKKLLSRIMSLVIFICAFLGIELGGKVEAPGDMISYDSGRVTAVIALKSNPSTGFDWDFEISDTRIVIATDNHFISGDTSGITAGAPGTRVFSFRGLAEGTATVTFNYLRPWEGEAIRTVVIKITVAADKTLSALLVSDTEK